MRAFVSAVVYTCLRTVHARVHKRICVCVSTVMKGLEFAAGGEFIITLIPLERDSLA